MNHNLLTDYKDIESIQDALENQDEVYWKLRGEYAVINLFQEMSRRVPAYKDFLKKNKVKANLINSIEDLKSVPPVDKNNYLRSYKLNDLCWDGNLKNGSWTISTTSGSTGEPFYFPRTIEQDLQYSLLAELYLRENFQIHKKSTLYVVGFPMGAWIGGVFTYEALRLLAERGNYPLSVITPGINKLELIKSIVNLGSNYDQVIIGSYGPFLKDILDDGINMGVNWKKFNLGFVFSAEGFPESFRDYVLRIAKPKNIYFATLNHYGTVDLGTMSYETPISILARRIAIKNNRIFTNLFVDISKQPTLTQYLPEHFYFEEVNGSLYCSARSGLPLVRYDLKDNGGVISFSNACEIFEDNGIDLIAQSKIVGIDNSIWKLPFVYVRERSDFSISYYAFQIYPQSIRKALLNHVLEKFVTSKFMMEVAYDHSHNQILEINVEMKRNIRRSSKLEFLTKETITEQLRRDNSEFRQTHDMKGDIILPNIILWKYEDPKFFKPGTKQKWVTK